jgi:hypothetical protein
LSRFGPPSRNAKRFSTAIVLEGSSPQQKVETILSWVSKGPQRLTTKDTRTSSGHEIQDSLDFQNLLAECGLLLLTPEGTTEHVVAEERLSRTSFSAFAGAAASDEAGDLVSRGSQPLSGGRNIVLANNVPSNYILEQIRSRHLAQTRARSETDISQYTRR